MKTNRPKPVKTRKQDAIKRKIPLVRSSGPYLCIIKSQSVIGWVANTSDGDETNQIMLNGLLALHMLGLNRYARKALLSFKSTISHLCRIQSKKEQKT